MITKIRKRDGRIEEFRIGKIADAIFAAARHVTPDSVEPDYDKALQLAGQVLYTLSFNDKKYKDGIPDVETIQDVVEKILIENGHAKTAKEYILYRQERSRHRELKTNLMETINELTYSHAIDSDIKRENGNINCDSAMGTMLKFGSSTAKEFNELYVLRPEHARAHHDGDIHIHDFDFYTLTTTCTQIPLKKLFEKGFSTGHGFLRTPNSIETYAALTCIAIQSNQNDQHGGQSIPMFDYDLSDGVKKSFVKNYIDSLSQYWSLYINIPYDEALQELKKINKDIDKSFTMGEYDEYLKEEYKVLRDTYIKKMDETQEPLTLDIHKIQKQSLDNAIDKTDKNTYQAMEALIHNLNTMNSRAGAQVPFSSINYGTDTSLEGRMIIKNVLLALDSGLGKHETPIFPIHIFKVKDGINGNPGDPNYDLFELACKVSAKRLFPNFSFIDAPFNLQYYKPGIPETEIAEMGCRTRVIGNIHDPSREIVTGRGNLSFTTINLPRLAIESNHDIDKFFDLLNDKVDLCIQQLLDRFEIQCQKLCLNYPFLMEQGVWLDSEKLKPTDEVREVLKHGTLSVGFIGLTETLISLIGKHHAESEEAQQLGLKIVKFMRDKMDEKSNETKLNFSLLATPAEGLCLAGDTLVQTPYGNVPIKDIKEGDQVFSYNLKTKEVEIDLVVKAGMTSPNRKVMKITFDTGQELVCTPNHPLLVRKIKRGDVGRIMREYAEFVPAEDLKIGDRISSNYIQISINGYRKVKGGKFIHKMVYEFHNGKIPKNYVVHHKNHNKQDNDISNLELLSDADHRILHLPETIKSFQYTSGSQSGEKSSFYGKHHTEYTKTLISDSKRIRNNLNNILKSFFEGLTIDEIADKFSVMRESIERYFKKNRINLEPNHIVKKIEYIEDGIPVYDLTMMNNSNFYVCGDQGICVHNSGRFVRIDKEKYGIIPGVTDKDYYTNSFHCPVYYKMSAFEKLDIEAPYHALTNAGHISYIELDGDPTENVEAFMKIVQYMKKVGIGYGAINHPVDTDPECGYQGIIGDVCPMCGRTESDGNRFKRIRRITGYLTTTLDRWNNAKQAEERDRVKHSYQD